MLIKHPINDKYNVLFLIETLNKPKYVINSVFILTWLKNLSGYGFHAFSVS